MKNRYAMRKTHAGTGCVNEALKTSIQSEFQYGQSYHEMAMWFQAKNNF